MNANIMLVHLIATASVFTSVVAVHNERAARAANRAVTQVIHRSAIFVPAPQRAVAQLKVNPGEGAVAWPNSGVIPILTYGWGGDRPFPSDIALDSSIVPPIGISRPPILIVQRRSDIFTPILQNCLDQNQTIRAMTITVKPVAGDPQNYTMWNVKVIGIRDIGKVVEENPVTQEIVFVFERLERGSLDEGGR
ncbi:MAG: hypothetical protein JST22_18775 [Bacteroidetes bacterium]|nr:hypothetical protein [Bacteroidota bacterium]